ncbi:D-psicose 3-epimerase [Tetragenococcus koreensis]|uniref:D-psicose 3-epimerase n=1 Tax=Tetragenococcus koreensis TaxID=290335 RepID=A0AAN4UBZ7_9ENTE|nr:sugar phosphate isomerase/epimerase family protein [Tetragenococcus koreensis]GEQ49652.1 D-psicose 3-epimerase [Tetragenococcus koreensis]GEQ52098.1 D-psicose 3-epimerase [Tetragenococcus koreensis]GEQ54633.1 D-psicose 3-epimerase [Tetragenococcus koreensis]GEQ57087.1 D-psicose 3-epimerase [Tetragenococcus koreensis]GEQ59665.1 D-psicose 3-epimerase [Tetragenococcus koreensis]
MKYGIYFAYWTKNWEADYFKYIDKVKKLGFDTLEISCAAFNDYYTKDSELIEIRDYAHKQGIDLTAGYGPTIDQNLCSEDEEVVNNAKKFFYETFRKLELLNIDFLGGGLYSYWPVDYSKPFNKEKEWARAVKNIREVSEVAEKHHVTLGMEVLNRYEGYLVNTAQEALEFVKEVDRSNVKIMLDTFHMNIEEDNFTDAIQTAGDYLGHFHIGEQNRQVPGKGILPWEEIGKALRSIDYTGHVVMEPFVMQGGMIASEIKVWRDLVDHPSEEKLDADAKSSLEFIKDKFVKKS